MAQRNRKPFGGDAGYTRPCTSLGCTCHVIRVAFPRAPQTFVPGAAKHERLLQPLRLQLASFAVPPVKTKTNSKKFQLRLVRCRSGRHSQASKLDRTRTSNGQYISSLS